MFYLLHLRMVDGKPTFSYCQQSRECLEEKLRGIGQPDLNVNLENNKNVNLENILSISDLKLEPSAGFGPATITLPR